MQLLFNGKPYKPIRILKRLKKILNIIHIINKILRSYNKQLVYLPFCVVMTIKIQCIVNNIVFILDFFTDSKHKPKLSHSLFILCFLFDIQLIKRD